jgi:6-methylsalicylate decarboxylase
MAGFFFPTQIRGLLYGTGISHSRLVYGSDFPFTRAEGVEFLLSKMDGGVKDLFNDHEIEDLYFRNAEKLLSM